MIGTIVATLTTELALSAFGYMSLNTCLLFGTLISAVDPVATLSMSEKCKAPTLLVNLAFGESVLTDASAVSIVLFQIFLDLMNDGEELTWEVEALSTVWSDPARIVLFSCCSLALDCVTSVACYQYVLIV